MKILLCSINSKYIHSSLSIWYLYESLKQNCNNSEIFVYESTINSDINKTISDISEYDADYICFSCYIWNISYIKNIIKSDESNKYILGGPEASHSAKELLEFSDAIKYIIMGEGEETLPKILNGDLCAGISYKKAEKIHIGDFVQFSGYINPYSEEYLKRLNGRIAYLESSRGCPFSCSFCLSGIEENVRFFDIEETKKNILLLANSGTKTVKFIDRTFNCNPKRTDEIIRFILEEYQKNIPEGVCFHFEVAADLFTENTILLLTSAPDGLFQIEAGIQSFNEKTLEACTRKTNISKIERNLKRLSRNRNIHIHTDLIAGLPYEDIISFENSFNRAYELKSDMLQLGFLKFLKGSVIRDNACANDSKFADKPPYEIISNNLIDEKNFKELKNIEEHLEKLYNSGRFKRTLSYLIKATKYSPYELFRYISYNIEIKNNQPLNDYVNLIYNLFSGKVDSELLRDIMICDFLSVNSSGHLPSSLYRFDKRLSKIRAEFNGKKGNAMLYYGKERAVIADYEATPHPVSHRYTLKFITINED